MRRAWIAWTLLAAAGLSAQTAPVPEVGLDVNGQADATVATGWPLLIRAVVVSADGQPVKLGMNGGAWTQALRLSVTNQNGAAQSWPVQAVAPGSQALNLSGIATAEAVWLVAPSDTANIAAGVYNLSATLDATAGAANGAWSGRVSSGGASVLLQPEPAALTAEQEASKYLAISAYSRLGGDAAGARTALDTLISRRPDALKAYTEKADLLAAANDFSGALDLYEQALSKFLAANPNAAEPLTLFTAPIADLAARLANQQAAAAGTVTSVPPGSTSTVFAADSIVTAYGSGLATGTASASGSLSTTLGGTTVTITNAAGAQSLAPLFYVSPGQVNYAAPASLAPGDAKIVVRAGDGSTHAGAATIVDVQPGLFTFNAAGLIAGSIVRGTADGKQIFQDIYSLDGAGNIAAAPVDLSKDQVYLILYGTGFRHAPQGQVTVTVGGMNLPAAYSGAQGVYIGLDQVNVLLPPSLAGRGDVPLFVTANGKQSNTARITLR